MPIWTKINVHDNVCWKCEKPGTYISIMKNVNIIKYSCDEHIKKQYN